MMKIWLNDVKEGDDFYGIINHQIIKCKHLGDAHNKDFKMPMIKCEDENHNIYELFVNQYVYETIKEANDGLILEVQKELNIINTKIFNEEIQLNTLKNIKKQLENILYGNKQ